MKYRVRLTGKAEQDVLEVLAWFRDQSAIEAGGKWFARLMAQIDKLETMPKRCGLAAATRRWREGKRLDSRASSASLVFSLQFRIASR